VRDRPPGREPPPQHLIAAALGLWPVDLPHRGIHGADVVVAQVGEPDVADARPEVESHGLFVGRPGARLQARLAEPMIDGEDLFDFTRTTRVADRLVELAKANHARLVAT
jgi:hypothetical protein